MEYPNSPYARTQKMMTDLTEGTISVDDFLAGLTRIQEKLERGYTRLEKMRPGDDCGDAQALVDGAAEALRTVYQGLEMLQAFPDTLAEQPDTEGEEVLGDDAAGTAYDLEHEEAEEVPQTEAETALELIRQGCEAMVELVAATEAHEKDLEGYSGRLLDGLFG